MKKGKRLLSLLLAAVIALTSFSVCFSAFADEAQANSDAKVTEAQDAIQAFYDYRNDLYDANKANHENAVAAYNDAAAKIKALNDSQKLALDVKYYAFFLYYATEKVARENTSLTSSNAKVWGSSTEEGLKALAKDIGDFPKDYQDAVDVMRKIYVKVDGTLFNTSFDFQKKTAGYEHYEKNVPEISKLTAKGADFANYMYVSGDGFYFNMTSPTANAKTDLYSNIARITYNYFQDKAGKNDPSTISNSSYIQGSGSARKWKDGKNAAVYRADWEAVGEKVLTDSIPYGREAWTKLIELFAPVFGNEFKKAADIAVDTGMKNFNGENVTVAQVDAVTAAIDAVKDSAAGAALKSFMSNSYISIAATLIYGLGSADAYTEDLDANTVYNNQISLSKKNVNALVNDLQNIVNNNRLNEFVEYMGKVDVNKLTDAIVKEAIEKYHAMSSDYQEKVPADVKEKLVNIATKGFYDIMKTVDMNNITREVQSKVYDKYVLMDEFKSTIPAELYDKYVLVQKPIMDMNNFAKELAAFKKTEIIRPENSKVAWTTGGMQSAVDKLWDLVANTLVPLIAKDIDLSNGLDGVLKDNLYQPEILTEILNLYATLLASDAVIDAGGMQLSLSMVAGFIVTNDKLANYLASDGDKYAGAVEKIKSATGANNAEKMANAAAMKFTAKDFGFKAGDREGFEDALLAVLRPITTLLAPGTKLLVVDVDIKMFDYMTDDGKYRTGVYSTLIPLLEQLGMIGLPTQEEYKANYESVKAEKGANIAADEFLRPIIDHLFTDVVDVISPDPLNGLIKVLPRLAHIVNTDMLDSTIKEAAGSLGVLGGAVEGLDVSKNSINNLLAQPIDLTDLLGIKLTLPPIDWAKLADCCTLEVVESSSNSNKYFILRNGDTDTVFTTLFYYVYDVVFADENTYKALRKLITDNLGALSSMVTNYTDKFVKIGKVETYGEVLELLGTPTGDAIEKPVTPVDPENPNKPSGDSNNNTNQPNINKPNLNDLINKGDQTNGNTSVKKNVKNPFIPKTGGESTAYVMMAVYSVLALAIGAAAVIYKKKKSDCTEK